MKRIVITESQYKRLGEALSLLNEQTNTPKEYDCIVEKYGDKGKEGDLYEYINDFLGVKKEEPKPIKSIDSNGECYEKGYLKGVIKGLILHKQKFTVNSGLTNKGKSLWNSGDCYICYKYKKDNTHTNICFSENRSFFVETYGLSENVNFKINNSLSKEFNLSEKFYTNYISYIGYWSTKSSYKKDTQIINVDIGLFKLNSYVNKDGKMVINKEKEVLETNSPYKNIIKLFTDVQSFGDGVIPLSDDNKTKYEYIEDLLSGYVSRDDYIESLKYIRNNFKSYEDFEIFNQIVKSSGNEGINNLLDEVSFMGDFNKYYKPSLFDVLNNKSSWTTLDTEINKIEKFFEE